MSTAAYIRWLVGLLGIIVFLVIITCVACPHRPLCESSPLPAPVTVSPFPDLSIFFLASGFALFIALLGWSDQIRGMTQDTQELEAEFLDLTKIKKIEFLQVIRPVTPTDQLEALTAIWTSGRLKAVPAIEVLGLFNEWNSILQRVEQTSRLKYNLTFVLTLCLLGSGLLSLVFGLVGICSTNAVVQLLLLFPSVSLIGVLLVIIIRANSHEQDFRALLQSISDRI